MGARFGAHAYDDPLLDLQNLKQVRSFQEYLDAIDELYHCVEIWENQALISFLSGLIDMLQMPVCMIRLKSLAEAYSLAKLHDIIIAAIKDPSQPIMKTPPVGIYYL